MEEQEKGSQDAPVFPVVRTTVLNPVTRAATQRGGHLPPGVARMVSLVGLSAALLGPLSGCGSGAASLPCPVPTSQAGATPVANGTPTATCTTSDGTHYVWIPGLGGWVPSDDGIHPDPGARGSGVDDGHGDGGVGDGHGGAGHGGGDGG